MRQETTLLLGAGASCPYGFPSGRSLRDQLIALSPSHAAVKAAALMQRYPGTALHQFCVEFRDSGMYSIDAFLSRRPNYQEIGKECIAALLLQVEDKWQSTDQSQDWYSAFWNEVATESLDDLDFKWLSVVTFNYDRSFEQFLIRAARATYGVLEERAAEVISHLRIVHVYGDLGSAVPSSSNYLSQEGGPTAKRVARASKSLRVMPEHRENLTGEMSMAIELLTKAERIAILGFGFDRQNLERLRASESLMPKFQRVGERFGKKTIVATCQGLTAAEAQRVGSICGIENRNALTGEILPAGFMRTDCVGLLRETLILSA